MQGTMNEFDIATHSIPTGLGGGKKRAYVSITEISTGKSVQVDVDGDADLRGVVRRLIRKHFPESAASMRMMVECGMVAITFCDGWDALFHNAVRSSISVLAKELPCMNVWDKLIGTLPNGTWDAMGSAAVREVSSLKKQTGKECATAIRTGWTSVLRQTNGAIADIALAALAVVPDDAWCALVDDVVANANIAKGDPSRNCSIRRNGTTGEHK